MILGQLKIKDFLQKTEGKVYGKLVSDAKERFYVANYVYEEDSEANNQVIIFRADATGDRIKVKDIINLDEGLVAFFGLYSGDGAKGSESKNSPIGKVKPSISFSQKEPNLVKFAAYQFRKIFGNSIRFNFAIGEDSAYFMNGEGYKMLKDSYNDSIPSTPKLEFVKHNLNQADLRYLKEKRPVQGKNDEHLAFYYFHKEKMEEILVGIKSADLKKVGITLASNDKITASVRRPFKKGARQPGGTSRSDEMHVGGLKGHGELFLKMLHEIEASIHQDCQNSLLGLVRWENIPSQVGEVINIQEFFANNPYGQIQKIRPTIERIPSGLIQGKWSSSKKINLYPQLKIDPLWCYTAGLYLAEGTTPKSIMFSMFRQRPPKLALSFTSSEGISLELMLRTLKKLFSKKDCLATWKVKVGSQYFPELVVTGLKEGVPMLRGGKSGDGKLRTMEISLAIKSWALSVAPVLEEYEDKYTHVEPTGAGVPRIDFSASSVLCRWYFPLIMYATFGQIVSDPVDAF